MALSDDLETALTAIQNAISDEGTSEPNLGDQVLEALTPVLTAAGWTAPAASEPEAELPETTE